MNEYIIGQIFSDNYPPEAALWCNSNKAYIMELELLDGKRRFQIVAIPEPTSEEIESQLQKHYTDLIQSILDKEAQALRL